MKLRVSVSRIEELRKVMTTEWATERLLIDSIREPSQLAGLARYGEALHACIEKPAEKRQADGSYAHVERDGLTYTWPAAIVEPCAAAWPTGCVFEKRAERDYRVGPHVVTVAGRVDSTRGLGIIEGKTRFGAVEPIDYAASLQWQFYLDMLPWARFVEYRIHEIGGTYADKSTDQVRFSAPAWTCACETDTGRLREKRKLPDKSSCEDCGESYAFKPGGPWLDEIHVFRVWREPGIGPNVRRWLDEFVGWADARGLLSHLVNRWAA